jgi:hypothetical protein
MVGVLPPPSLFSKHLRKHSLMKHRTFFWFFFPTGMAMLLFIALPILSVVTQSLFTPHEAVLVTVETCTPFKCTEETAIDQEATAAIRAAEPLGRFVGLDIYFDRGHLAIIEVSEAWRARVSFADFLSKLNNLPFYRAIAFTLALEDKLLIISGPVTNNVSAFNQSISKFKFKNLDFLNIYNSANHVNVFAKMINRISDD